jgi:hypothetical protein
MLIRLLGDHRDRHQSGVLLMDFESISRSDNPANSVRRDNRSVLAALGQIHRSIASCVRQQAIDCG